MNFHGGWSSTAYNEIMPTQFDSYFKSYNANKIALIEILNDDETFSNDSWNISPYMSIKRISEN